MSKEVKELESGSVLGKYHCPACGSNDNLVVYVKHTEEGDEYLDASCFTPSCENKYMTEAMLKEQGVLDEDFKAPKTAKVTKTAITRAEYDDLVKRTTHDTTLPDGSFYRGIKPETAKFYHHLFEKDEQGNIIKTYYPENKSTFKGECGTLRGYKVRGIPKRFGLGNIGITGLSNNFSGQRLFPNGGKFVLVVGGEEDKLAASQMLRDYQLQRNQEDYDRVAVVSVVCGEATLAKQCANEYEWLDSFENIIICMDNDEAGKNAVKDALKVLPEGKVKVMTCSLNDPSAMLQAGKQKQFISNYYDAKPLIETGIISAVDASEGIREHLLAEKITLPLQLSKLQEAMRGGIKSTGAIVNVIGQTSVGKTFLSDTLIHHWIYHSPLVPTILTIERTASELILDMYSYHLKQNLTWFEDGNDAIDYLEQPEVKALCDDMLMNEYGEPRFHVIDDREGTIEVLQKQCEQAMKQYGSRLFILDVLTDVIRSLPLDKQEEFMQWEKQMKKKGAVFINILHTRKPQQQSKGNDQSEEGGKFARVNEYDILGSGSIPQSADYNIVLNRNKLASDLVEKNTTYVDLPKCRGGVTGSDICKLYYDPTTRQQYDRDEWLENNTSNF